MLSLRSHGYGQLDFNVELEDFDRNHEQHEFMDLQSGESQNRWTCSHHVVIFKVMQMNEEIWNAL